jgi:hypothetical protein
MQGGEWWEGYDRRHGMKMGGKGGISIVLFSSDRKHKIVPSRQSSRSDRESDREWEIGRVRVRDLTHIAYYSMEQWRKEEKPKIEVVAK